MKPILPAVSCFVVMTLMNVNESLSVRAEDDPCIAIIPKPVTMSVESGFFEFTERTSIYVYDGFEEAHELGTYLSGLINRATGFLPSVSVRTTVDYPRGSIIAELDTSLASLGTEGYALSITPDFIVCKSFKPAGIFYAFQTLHQLMSGFDENSWSIPCLTIEDRPAFPWRGLCLDCVRHFISIDFLKRYVDLLAYHKMNVLHLHLTDDQGWRIEINRYPLLTQKGAWRKYGILTVPGKERACRDKDMRHGGYYTKKELKELVAYAKSRYVTIVPEIEMPGHSSAAVACYPGLSCTGKLLPIDTTVYSKKNLFCIGKEETFEFLQNVLQEVCEIFPSPYIHIGSDEALKNNDNWKVCPLCQKRIRDEDLKDENELQGYFVKRIDAFMQTMNRNIISWDEILEGGVSPNAIVQSWRTTESAVQASKMNHFVIMSPYQSTYLDMGQDLEQSGSEFNGHITLKKIYSFEPVPQTVAPTQASYILGGECCMWTESVFEHQVDERVFPRMCAFSEVLWTPGGDHDFSDFSKRMEIQYNRLTAMGVHYHISR